VLANLPPDFDENNRKKLNVPDELPSTHQVCSPFSLACCFTCVDASGSASINLFSSHIVLRQTYLPVLTCLLNLICLPILLNLLVLNYPPAYVYQLQHARQSQGAGGLPESSLMCSSYACLLTCIRWMILVNSFMQGSTNVPASLNVFTPCVSPHL
jgi:hypothetical protein